MTPRIRFSIYRRSTIGFISAFFTAAALLFICHTKAQTRHEVEIVKAAAVDPRITVHARKSGFPNISFNDGTDLITTANTEYRSQTTQLVSADFDSDGVPDLITADFAGLLRYYKGNGNPQTKVNDPLEMIGKEFSLGFGPDFISAGDFNADGNKDILAASKGSNLVAILPGDGRGNFSSVQQIGVAGNITAFSSGEIGRSDGQADLAVGVTNENGSFLLVYEHPEGAFKHDPETVRLPAPANDIALGNLDGDFFSDIAVACGNTLVMVHGRGQAYPWDIVKGADIKRPPAVVADRRMEFYIAALAVGQFSDERGNSLALLSSSGSVYRLQPTKPNTYNLKVSKTEISNGAATTFLPSGVDSRDMRLAARQDPSAWAADGSVMYDPALSRQENIDIGLKRLEEAEKKIMALGKDERARQKTAAIEQTNLNRERAKADFLRTISAQPSTLAAWKLEALTTDGRLQVVNSPSAKKLIVARVSTSGLDDLVMLDSASRQIQIVTQPKTDGRRMRAEVTSLDVDSTPYGVLPMRLNRDAMDDLVVLRAGASVPSIVLTAPTIVITVNDTGDQFGDCSGGGTCTLRSAIIAANSLPGSSIEFDLPGPGTHTISILSELPVIGANGTTIDGSTQPGFNQFPIIEIKGNLIPAGTAADGIKLRASNCYVGSLTINELPSTFDGQSQHGGNGITSESLLGTPVNGNNSILGNFLGTDLTGTIAKGGTGATGVNIFTSDNNFVLGNLMSGNAGAGLSVTAGNSNRIWSNYIGPAVNGTTPLPNPNGVFLTGANNQFGADGLGNTVSGNRRTNPGGNPPCYGVGILIPVLVDVNTGQILTGLNLVKGNRIGTSADGTHPLGNCQMGIDTEPLTTTVIGSIAQNGRNIISDNGLDAIHCINFFGPSAEGGFCAIIGNNIGTDINGTTAIPNDWRNQYGGLVPVTGIVTISNDLTVSNFGAPGGTTSGGACTGFCNLLSGNGSSADGALTFFGTGLMGAFNSYIGTDSTGTQPLPNENLGIAAGPRSSDVYIGGVGLPFAAPGISLGNVVSSNPLDISSGYFFGGDSSNIKIQANLIGTDAQGINAVNINSCDCGYGGISIVGVTNGTVQIGDADILTRNVIAGVGPPNPYHSGNGIYLQYNPAADVRIVNNYIGVNKAGAPLGNLGNGIELTNLGGAVIGGATAAEENLIQNNGGTGILVVGNGPSGIDIQRNKIKNNSGLGIDLSLTGGFNTPGDGVTINDCGDTDTGPNELQNYPVLATPIFNPDGTVSIGGSLRTELVEGVRIDFYSNSAADPSGYGQGENFIGSINVITDGNGFANIGATSTVQVPSGSFITATATNENGSTSEFSCVAGQCVGAGRPDSPTTGCPLPMVVNNTTDDHDADLTDGVCDTDTNNPGFQCSLRAALEQANDSHAFSRSISFNIPGAGVQTITPSAALPSITKPVRIYGSTQGGAPNTHLIEINGSSAGGNADGLTLDTGSDGSVIDELTINHFFTKFGINIKASSNNEVKGCYLGLNSDGLSYPPATGTSDVQLGGIGVGTPGNTIGGPLSIDSNIVSGNSIGITIAGGGSNKVLKNKIGTDKNGNAFMDNGTVVSGNLFGILISASDGNIIGGDIASTGNQISDNGADGLVITNSKNNFVKGNFIGTDASGLHAVQNGRLGIGIAGGASSGNTVGGTNPSDRNIISGNNFNAASAGVLIDVSASTGNKVLGNYIGVDVNAQNPLPNFNGVYVLASGNTIGSTAAPNVISGNSQGGVVISSSADTTTTGTSIIGNYIGVNQNGVSIANSKVGVILVGGVQSTNIRDNIISGNTTGAGVAIAFGSGFSTAPTNNTLFRNKIGTDPTGNTAVPNTIGVLISQASTNTINGNIISGNSPGGGVTLLDDVVPPSPDAKPAKASETFPKGAQVESLIASLLALPVAHASTVVESPDKNFAAIQRPSLVSQTSGNQITGNYIGLNAGRTTAVPNAPAGVIITKGASGNTVGGNSSSTRNIISGNTDTGVFIGNITVSGTLPTGNIVTGNYIGTDAAGTSGVPNTRYGVWLLGAQANFIGGNTADLGNLIGFNLQDGIAVQGNDTTGNVVEGNTLFLNGANGIKVQGVGPNNNALKILNNKIGTDDNGSAGMGNGANGIKIDGQGTTPRPRPQYAEGVPTIPIEIDDNTVVSNGENGIEIDNIGTPAGCSANVPLSPPFPGVKLTGNYISISIPPAAPEVKLPNVGTGVLLNNASGVVIGTVNDTRRNIISGSVEAGVKIQGNSTQNTIKAGVIGTDLGGASSYGNGGGGIIVTDGASSTEIGGPEPGADNIIADNTGPGVWIQDNAGNCNLVDPNSIYANSGLGIDIGPEGINPNDPGDADLGPNNLQNYPDVPSLFIDGNGDLIVDYRVDSTPGNSNYGTNGIYVEFFKSDASGQGQLFLGSDHFTVGDYNNSGSKQINLGNAALLGYAIGDLITSTATDADGNTSEFFPVIGVAPTPTSTATPSDTPTAAPTNTPTDTPIFTPTSTATATSTSTATPTATPVGHSVSGIVSYGNAIGEPASRFVPNVLISGAGSPLVSALTDALGSYTLSGFGSGAYTIMPSKTGGTNSAISSFDAAKVAQHVVGPPMPHLTGNQMVVADVSGNGDISSFDAAEIAHYVVSNVPTGTTGTWKFSPVSNFHASINSSVTGEDYVALLLGDVSGNWNDPTSLPGGRPAMLGGPERNIAVAASRLVTPTKHEVVIPIRVDGAANKRIIAYEFDLRYDSSVIRPQANPVDLVGTISRGLTAVFNTNEPGHLRVAVYGPMPIDGTGVLLNLRFTAVGKAWAVSPLTWERIMFNEGYPGTLVTDGQVKLSP